LTSTGDVTQTKIIVSLELSVL